MGLLAKFNPKTRSNNNRSANSNSGPSTGGQNVSEAMFNLTGISGINYDFDSAKQGNFESYLNAVTPEQAQNAQKNAEKLKETKKNHSKKLVADTESFHYLTSMYKTEAVHERKRIEDGLSARDEWVKSQQFFNEKVQPKMHPQNSELSLSQSKGQQAISEIDATFAQRRQHVASLRGAM